MKNANSQCLNGRPLVRDLQRLIGAAGAHRQRRQLPGAVRSHRWCRRRRAGGLRRHPGHRLRRRHRGARPRAERAQRPGRRVGPQPAALGRGRRGPGLRLLLRPARLHRDAAQRPRHGARPSAARRRRAVRAARLLHTRLRGDAACVATLDRYAARLARALAGVINLLDPDVIVLAGGLSPHRRAVRAGATRCGAAGCSPAATGTRCAPGSCRAGMATPRACAARPGCGVMRQRRSPDADRLPACRAQAPTRCIFADSACARVSALS